jgi:hypothetical protein
LGENRTFTNDPCEAGIGSFSVDRLRLAVLRPSTFMKLDLDKSLIAGEKGLPTVLSASLAWTWSLHKKVFQHKTALTRF